jgi:hypothetical protein
MHKDSFAVTFTVNCIVGLLGSVHVQIPKMKNFIG